MHDIVTSAARREQYLAAGLWDDETLVGRVTRIASLDPDRVAVVDTQGGPPRTYADLERDAELVAAGLREIGILAGDVASVQLPNRYEAVVCALAIQKCHAVINPLLPNYRRKEIEHVFAAARPKVIFTPGIYRGFDHPALVREAAAAVGVAPRNVVVDGDTGDAGIALSSLLRGSATPTRAPAAGATGRSASAIERGVLDHPSDQLIKGDARMRRELGHERRLRHPGLRIHFEADQPSRPLNAIVVAEIRPAHSPAAERTMCRNR